MQIIESDVDVISLLIQDFYHFASSLLGDSLLVSYGFSNMRLLC